MGTDGKLVTSEFQLYAGYKNKIKKFHYDIGLMRYFYPNAIGPNFTEGYFYLGYEVLSIGIARSSEVLSYVNESTYHGTYYSSRLIYDLANINEHIFNNINFGVGVGRYIFSNNNSRDKNYTDYQFYINKLYKKATFQLKWTHTNKAGFAGQSKNNIIVLSIISSL
jgi:uncharacterized protein (TIGR02001 family)